jgi:hypothetical protein
MNGWRKVGAGKSRSVRDGARGGGALPVGWGSQANCTRVGMGSPLCVYIRSEVSQQQQQQQQKKTAMYTLWVAHPPFLAWEINAKN